MYIYIISAVVLVLVVVGGYSQREILRTYFETGDVPTEEQFSDTIDSSLNMNDDGQSEPKVNAPSKDYLPGDTSIQSEPVYQARVLSQGKPEFSLEAPVPVTFRWTPVVPKPQEPVTYRLKVWQLMQGQNGSQAMKSNQPIVTKDVTDVAEVTVSGIYTGPCRPPYLCDFVWSVAPVVTPSPMTDTGAAAGTITEPSTETHTGIQKL